MNLKYIKINLDYHYQDGTNFDLSFFGINENENLTQEQIEKNINNIFKNMKTSPSIVDAATTIKTILKDINLTHLIINIYKDEVFSQSVNYWLSKLGIYYYHQEITPETNLDIRVDYSIKKGLKINLTDKNNNVIDNTNMKILEEQISIINQLQSLKEVKILPEDERLIHVYRLFFQENPNFINEDTRRKTHLMLVFLEEFGMDLYNDNNEELIFDFDYQTCFSRNLEQHLYKLSLFGEITNDIEEKTLSTRAENTVKIIGKTIKENMQKNSNPIEWFEKLIKLTYAKNYCLPNGTDELEIAEYTPQTEQFISQNIKILNKKP